MIRVKFTMPGYTDKKEGILVGVDNLISATVLCSDGTFKEIYTDKLEILNLKELFPPKEQPQTVKENVPEKVMVICEKADKENKECRQCDMHVPWKEISTGSRRIYCWRRSFYINCNRGR